jgi:hypothetical protein
VHCYENSRHAAFGSSRAPTLARASMPFSSMVVRRTRTQSGYKDSVVVVQEKSWFLSPCGSLPELLFDPVEARVRRHVDEHDAARSDLHHDEDVHGREKRRGLRQEVDCKDLGCVVLDERPPGLTISRFAPRPHVLPERASRVVHAQLDGQFLCDLVLPSLRVLTADATNQNDVLKWNRRTTGFTRSPLPVATAQSLVPGNDGSRFDHYQSRAPTLPDLGQDDPEHALVGPDLRAPSTPSKRGELLSKGEVLHNESCP